jgi:hypothetical protein
VVDVADDRSLRFEERAYENYRSEIREIGEIVRLIGERELDGIEEYREPLSVEERKELTILLSWGGPSDGYKIIFDRDNHAIDGSYFFADWFEYKEFRLSSAELDDVLTVYPVCPEL